MLFPLPLAIYFFNKTTPFNGDKVRPRVAFKAKGKTFSWIFDTGASASCLTSTSFHAAVAKDKPQKVRDAQDCIAASGDKMNSLGIYEIDLHIKGKNSCTKLI
jgi:hypothetical protein